MALHISGKLAAVGVVIAALITAFTASRGTQDQGVPLAIAPTAVVRSSPVAAPSQAAARLPGPVANPVYVLRATGYNSLVDQTDSTPYITSTGQRTHFGIIAVSPDLLWHDLPYGSLVRLTDLGNYYSGRGYGHYQSLLNGQGLFIVEDTMHYTKRDQIDIWFADYASAVNWGVRKVRVEVVRYGRNGPELRPSQASDFRGMPRFLASR